MLRYTNRATDRVTVICRHPVYDEGEFLRYEETARIGVTGRVTAVSTDEAGQLGAAGVDAATTVKRLRCFEYPGDEHSQVITGDGVLYDVIGEPRRATHMRLRPQDSVLMRRIG